ncbi:hypothetical protein [Limnochorda pilosa]|uniref:Histidine kinase N-terminal 7TM region domain-containing protein n=1 Tax=Limnochorda pilosa TaxID=1555112 RepID=A0A0K2SPV2_LIMPI|nr:hypothetical protein [Limnochorda pilosa]BAS29042.1 hypothetical protein LIP_3225 [Limnochorda pilosa]
MIYPTMVALISLVFSVALARQYAARRKPHQLFWTLALVSGFLGAVGYLAAARGSAAGFRLYYLAGALWMAPVMGLGSVYLHFARTWRRAVAAAVAVLGLVASAGVAVAPLDVQALAALEGGPGQHVLDLGGPALASLIVLNTFGLVAVAGLAILSALRMRRHAGGGGFVLGNVLLAAGVILLGMAGSLARVGVPGGFWLLMALGFLILYVGFVRITAATARQEVDRAERPATGS